MKREINIRQEEFKFSAKMIANNISDHTRKSCRNNFNKRHIELDVKQFSRKTETSKKSFFQCRYKSKRM